MDQSQAFDVRPRASWRKFFKGSSFVGAKLMTSTGHASSGMQSAFRARMNAYHAWRIESPVVTKLGLAVLFAGVMGLLAQVQIPLPFTPVPMTGQVFGVLLSAVLLGAGWGAASQALYVGAGAAGLPWYANFSGGAAVFTGVTGGYLVGFVVATALIGYAVERYTLARRYWPLVGVMFLGIAAIHVLGVIWLSAVLDVGLVRGFTLGSAPFLVVDAVKAFAAAGLGVSLVNR